MNMTQLSTDSINTFYKFYRTFHRCHWGNKQFRVLFKTVTQEPPISYGNYSIYTIVSLKSSWKDQNAVK